jgi:DNA polymerase-4/DNA polymerase V
MFAIFRRYTPQIEEYSIDEAFLDITGTRGIHHCSYEQIAQTIREDVRNELGITVSAGLSLSKSLAKLCSKFRKPDGFTGVKGKFIHMLLQRTELDDVWGFGHNSVSLLRKHGIKNAYDFVLRKEGDISRLLKKPGREIWHELRGTPVRPVTGTKPRRASIIRSRTFSPPSSDQLVIYARLAENTEKALAKARRHRLMAGRLCVVLRLSDYREDGIEIKLTRPASSSIELLSIIHEAVRKIIRPGTEYRSTLIALGDLRDELPEQYDLFEDRTRIDSIRRVTSAVDTINSRFGNNTLRTASSLWLQNAPENPRETKHTRAETQVKGEAKRRLRIPRSDITV